MSALVLRRAIPEDAMGIAKVLHEQKVLSAMLMPTVLESALRTEDRIRALIPERDAMYVAQIGDKIVGYGAVRWFPGLILQGPDAYLSELFVLPEFCGQKIGSKILAELKRESQELGCTRLWCINLRARDSYQRGYYKNIGWEEKDIAVFFKDLKV